MSSTPGDATEGEEDGATTRVWLVERTYSDDEQNIIILVYATPDGSQYLRKERSLTSFSDVRDTTAAVDTDDDHLGTVDDEETRARYAAEVERIREQYGPDDTV
ncbi:hypothetical protein NDI76_06770 [Halogeometricum sp. S1BR25-6]|uniref:DUF7967 domain-containing protein n=1 Tax=Halogeometricum salsisoli TaxID=2950536 RepID=A0ABU2GCG1_9EURY|nr:hypothetical protein [Halogeometricum sp. S1BR25-6]MDS0298439.1 hypothetical protein [Halogeometricum sp. S1BR25-6]